MQTKHNTAIIVAAGGGRRFGSPRPKQFVELRGREILSYSVQAFLEHPSVDNVIIVTSTDYLDHVTKNYPDCTVVPGGASRQDSVKNGLDACPENTQRVLVHDAARPLVPARIIDACIEELKVLDGVAPALIPVDSMIQIKRDGFLNLHRESLRIVQTPQCFRYRILNQAHDSGLVDTDEMGLVKQANPKAKLGFVIGAPEIRKITHVHDLEIVKTYLR